MQNKKAIKYILMFVFTLVVFGYNTMEVGAADKEFPVYGRDCNKETTAKVDIYDHCSYRMSSVERYYVSYVVGVSVPAYRIGDYYHSKELIMVRSNNDTILLADPNYGCDGGGSSPFISAYNNKAYTWDNSGINQTIMIATPISKVHLIQSTGETTCPKLCFIETSGSLSIYTNDDFLEKYSNDIEAGVFDSNKLVWPCADGTLIKGSQTKEQANSKTTECDDTKKAALTAKYQELYKNMESYYNSKISETKAAYERSYEEGINYENGAQHNMIVKNNSQITGCDTYITDDGVDELKNCDESKSNLYRMYRDTGCFDETYKQRGKELDDLFSKKLDELSKIKNNYEQKAIDNGEITKEEAEELRKRVDNSREKITDYNKQLYRKFLNYVSNIDNSLLTGTTGDFDTCEGILGPDVMHDISKYLGYLRILAPILVIILSAVDYGKAVLSDDDKALGKATSNLVKRLIIAAIVCFAPLILMYLVDAASKFVESSWNGCDLREWWSW